MISKILIGASLLTFTQASIYAQPAPLRPEQQIAPSDERISGIVAQQALINARLGVEIDQLRQTNRKLEVDLAQAKRELEAERKAHVNE